MSLITLENVSKTFHLKAGRKLLRDHIRDRFRTDPGGQFYALKNVSFKVNLHESVGVIGRNGAGKSTLLSMIAGLARPDEGHLEINGRVAALLELGSGFHPDLTGLENINLNAALLGFNRQQARSVLESIIDFAGVGEFIQQPLRTYSAGMVVRLAFSVAVHVEPAILVVDEVLAVGDAGFHEKSVAKVRELLDAGKTLFCVSHSADMIRSFCRRAIWLDKGELILDGPSEEVTAAYQNYIDHPEGGLPVHGRTSSLRVMPGDRNPKRLFK